MSMKTTIEGDDRVVAQLQQVPDLARTEVRRSIGTLALKLTRKVQEEKLTGQVLKVRTGNLRRSISNTVVNNEGASVGIVSTNTKYARIHEYGGTIKARIIEAKKKQALAFSIGGKQIVRKRVTVPEVRMPERSFLRSALREMQPEIQQELAAAVTRAVRGAK